MVAKIRAVPTDQETETDRADALHPEAMFQPGRAIRTVCLWAVILLVLSGCGREDGFDLERTLKARPAEDQMVFDYVGVTQDVRPSIERQLAAIRDQYKIEILIVILPSLGDRHSVTDAAVQLFSNWGIGKQLQGRGVLMLLVDDVKTVKLEVGFELEDVFTDLFTGYIQDVQLQPYFTSGKLDIGLIAMMEEIEARSQIKYQGRYSRASVAALDARYLSQGAGARHVLEEQERPAPTAGVINSSYPAGSTPEQAWQTMIRHWHDKVRDPDLGVYTAITRLTYRDYIHLPDARFDQDYRRYARKSYEVRQSGDYAVIYFGREKGWENSPFFFCRCGEGWMFDIVHQRRFVRMGTAPHWGIEFSEHPFMGLLMDAFHFNGQDIPLAGDDLYTIEKDAWWAEQVVYYEALHQSDENDADVSMALGRLYTLVSMSRKAIPLLKAVQQRSPQDARPYKYLAIAWVNAYYQYDKALNELDTYIALAPQDPFGHRFRGYLHYRQKQYGKAVADLEAALQLNPEDGYAHFYLTYAYAGLYQEASRLDPRRSGYKERFGLHRERTRSFTDRHPLRVAWLNRSYPDGSRQGGD